MTWNQVWSIVLAGGDGQRVRSLATDRSGRPIPKQFWEFDGRRSLLGATLDRMGPLIPRRRAVPVVARDHHRWWRTEFHGLPDRNVVVQPANRGTAAGVLLPLMRVIERDRNAVVVVLPSDHWVDDDETLRRSVATATAAVRDDSHRLVLLGMEPADGDIEYGWIVPRSIGAPGLCAVARFVEKPRAEVCHGLRADGALVNSMIVVARASTLLNLFYLATPRLLWEFVKAHENAEGDGLDSLYEFLPTQDFSRDVLEPLGDRLTVLPVPDCGWTDVGTPNRVARVRRTERGPLRIRRAAAGAPRADAVSVRR